MLWIDALRRSLRYALRTLARAPGFTATVVLTLALGIGANTAVFSAIRAVLLQPLPFPNGERLVRIAQTQQRNAETNIAPIRLEEWNESSSTFEAITGYYTEDESETSGDFPERVRRAWVAPRFFDVWEVAPHLGRVFTAAEQRAGGPPAVVVSDRYWHRRFGGDPNVIGKTIRIRNGSFPIVGVMPAAFLFSDRQVDIWFPVGMGGWLAQARNATWYVGVGRLKPGVTPAQARADLAVVQSRLGERYPETDRTIGVTVVALKETTVQGLRASLWLLYGAVSLLLLITCTNIAALLLSRASQRRHEIAVRLSIGASRVSVAAQMITETVVLASMGGAVGAVAAAAAVRAFRSAAAGLPRVDEIAIDGGVLLYTFGVAIAVALLCGVFPAMRIGRGNLAAGANDAGRTQVSGRHAIQWTLVGLQVALSVTLLVGAGLLARSFQELFRVNPGFDPAGVLTFRISATWNETTNYDRLVQRIERTLDELKAIPGVVSTATALFPPGVPIEYESTFDLVEAPSTDRHLAAESRSVSPAYFATMRIAVTGGELCRMQPVNGPKEAMVNRAFASRYLSAWPSAIGLHLSSGNAAAQPARIVGVVADARERGLDRDPPPIVYTCFSAPNPTPNFLVRSSGDPAAVASAVRVKIKELEPLRAVYDMAPLEARIGDAFAQNRLRTMLVLFFAATALLLACVGLYGTLSYTVSVRRREVGLRLALGAVRADIVRQFLFQALRIVGVGCVCGVAIALASARVLSGMLFGVSPSDPRILAAVTAVVLAVATLSALLPAARAAWVAPMRVLRDE